MKNGRVGVGIVGAKFAADFHCDAFTRNEHAEIVAAASPSGALNLAEKWNIPHAYTDFREMVKRDDIDVISVCVPNFLHHEVALNAARHGKHVIVEKSLATTVEDAVEMVRVCNEHKVLLMYAEDWLFSPALRKAEELVREGGIGEVLYVKAKEVHNGTHSPFAKNKEFCGGGSFIHPGSMTSTHSASPLAVAAALANLETLRKEDLVENAWRMGEILIPELRRIQQKYPGRLGTTLGRGLVAGVLAVKEGSREPDPETALKINVSCYQKGLLMFAPVGPNGESIKIAPPLCISEGALRDSIGVFEEAVEETLG